MIKRPLNARFSGPVLAGKKTTTIRDKAWPVGVPIMLYNWSGAAYRSKQIDVAAVVVKGFWTIRITHRPDGAMAYECGKESGPALYESEGFASQDEMDEWFRPLVKPGRTVEKTLMLFRRSSAEFGAVASGSTFHFWGDDYPKLADLSGGWKLIAHPNGPALCDGDCISVIDIHPADSEEMQAMKREAQEAFREWAWPQLKGTLALPIFKKPNGEVCHGAPVPKSKT